MSEECLQEVDTGRERCVHQWVAHQVVQSLCSREPRAVASGPAGQAMAGPVLINYVDTHAQMQQLSASYGFVAF